MQRCFHLHVSSGRSTLFLGLLASVIAIAALASCEDDEPSVLSLLGDSCRLNSDCDGGLVCAYRACVEACAVSSDCQSGRCVLGPDKVHLCQPDGALCTFNSNCLEPLVCARDGQCRNQCAADRDCIQGQLCTSATCAEPDEVDAEGELPEVGDPLGKPCNYASDCGFTDTGLVLSCRSQACTYACFEARDCGRYQRCTTADDPAAPGNCEFIGPVDSLVCDPLVDPPTPCFCPPNAGTMVPCNDDGSGYDCQCD